MIQGQVHEEELLLATSESLVPHDVGHTHPCPAHKDTEFFVMQNFPLFTLIQPVVKKSVGHLLHARCLKIWVQCCMAGEIPGSDRSLSAKWQASQFPTPGWPRSLVIGLGYVVHHSCKQIFHRHVDPSQPAAERHAPCCWEARLSATSGKSLAGLETFIPGQTDLALTNVRSEGACQAWHGTASRVFDALGAATCILQTAADVAGLPLATLARAAW